MCCWLVPEKYVCMVIMWYCSTFGFGGHPLCNKLSVGNIKKSVGEIKWVMIIRPWNKTPNVMITKYHRNSRHWYCNLTY